MPRVPRLLLVALVAVAVIAAAGCGDDDGSSALTASPATTVAGSTGAPTAAATAVEGDITVFAAASLSAAFTEIGTAFAEMHPDAKATFSFDASSALVQQITRGAPADVFASADTATMDRLTAAGLNGSDPVVFATNSLEIIVGPGNPKGIDGLADLAEPELKVVLCAPEVPCGRYAALSLQRAGVSVTPASLEQNVRGVVTKVTAGEADAGIVYATDVKAAGGKAAGVEIPADVNVVAEYPVASVKTSDEADIDQAYIAFLTGSEGQAILAKYGFGAP
jgi:molybdate transport system substrate-binding protein